MAYAAEFDPRTAHVSLAELSDLFAAPVAIVSSPERQLNGLNAMTISEQLPEKLQPGKESRIISIVDFMGSTSGEWTNKKILDIDPATGETKDHSGDFDRDLTNCGEFNRYFEQHRADFAEKANNNAAEMRSLAKKRLRHQEFAVEFLLAWQSRWRPDNGIEPDEA